MDTYNLTADTYPSRTHKMKESFFFRWQSQILKLYRLPVAGCRFALNGIHLLKALLRTIITVVLDGVRNMYGSSSSVVVLSADLNAKRNIFFFYYFVITYEIDIKPSVWLGDPPPASILPIN